MSKILKNLYLGDSDDALETGIKCDVIINLNYPRNGVKWRRIKIDDSSKPTIIKVGINDSPQQKTLKMYYVLTKIIHEYLRNGKKVIVHCYAGVSRSASTVIAYLIKYKGMSLEEAYKFVKKRRPIIDPNKGFMRELVNWEEEC